MKPIDQRSRRIKARRRSLARRLPALLLGTALLLGLGSCQATLSPLSGTKAMTAFSFEAQTAVGLVDEASGSIAITVPYGTNLKTLIATFAANGDRVLVGGVAQASGTTPNDFSYPVAYRVCAADGSSTSYLVAVSIASNTSKRLTSLVFPGSLATTISEANKTIAVKMPYGSSLTALIAGFATTGVSVKVGDKAQTSASSANDFSNPVVYTVVAADGSSVEYTVTVNLALNPAKAITSFSFSIGGESVSIDQSALTIAVSLPYWNGSAATDLSALVASFETTGSSVKIGTVVQTSGSSSNSFLSPKAYKVTAADGTAASYSVSATRLPAPKVLTAFSIASTDALIDQSAKTVFLVLPVGSDLTGLIPTFALSQGASATVSGAAQTSGTTNNNFSDVLHYLIVPADGGTPADYSVTVVAKPEVPSVVISPAGTYVRTISLSCATAGAEIHYSTDGSVPTSGSPLYTAPITAAGFELSIPVRAVATKLGASSDTVLQSLRVGSDFGSLSGSVSTSFAFTETRPWGVATDGTYFYVTMDDSYQSGTQYSYISKINISTGVATLLAGSKTEKGIADAFGSSARFNEPAGIVWDGGLNLYVADCDNHAIRKIVISTGEVSTIAGTGTRASMDGNGTAASFQYPAGLAYDGKQLYVVDSGGMSIRRIDLATMNVTTIAGGSSYGHANGLGAKASFYWPTYIATDGANLYVYDSQDEIFRKIALDTLQVTTLAGSSQGYADGIGAQAKFSWAGGMISDGSYLYVPDGGYRLRRINISTREVSFIAGSGSRGTADGLGNLASFENAAAVVTDGTRLFLIDNTNGFRLIQ